MKLFIGCASSDEISYDYVSDCTNYLKILLKGNDLVFGADNKGLMGKSYEIVKECGGKVIGICPERYKDDFKKLKCDYELITNSVYDRTLLLIENSDACVFLPGGFGTIYELFALIESKRFHEFDKPIVIYNSCHYFDDLINLLGNMFKNKFADERMSEYYHISYSADDTLNYINSYEGWGK